MTALKCDACNGTLTMDDSGEYAVCDYCGMRHTRQRISAKVQEIKGVVEITKGNAEKERLLKNAETFLSLNEADKAESIYRQLTDDFPDDYRGWFGLAKITLDAAIAQMKQSDLSFTTEMLSPQFPNDFVPLLEKLKQENAYASKISILGAKDTQSPADIANALNQLEAQEQALFAAYLEKQPMVINRFSLAVFYNHKLLDKCSVFVFKQETQMISRYIDDFLSGKNTYLVWHYPNDQDWLSADIHLDAMKFCKHGSENAKNFNQLPLADRRKVLRAWGLNNAGYGVTEETPLYFLLGPLLGMWFSHPKTPNILPINRVITPENLQQEIQKGLSADMSRICERCRNPIGPLGFCTSCGSCNHDARDAILAKLGTHLANPRDYATLYRAMALAVDRNAYIPVFTPFNNDRYKRSFSFSLSKPDRIDLLCRDSEKGLFGKTGAWVPLASILLTRHDALCRVYVAVLRHNGLCQFCGGSFTGLLTKTCTKCGKTKTY